MVNYNGREETGKGGAFKEERTVARARTNSGADSLAAFGSLAECIETVIAAGAYISFGRTSDGGATLIRVLDNDKKLSSYCSSRAEILEAMEALNKRYAAPDMSKVKFTDPRAPKQPELPKN